VKRKYFFGYFFFTARKPLALLVLAIGAGFCILEYSHANTSTSATAYQPSTTLHRALSGLTDSFASAERIVSVFNADHQLKTPRVEPPRFPPLVSSNLDFDQVDEVLTKADRQRQLLKESIVSRFEALVGDIETKLRTYAAGMASASPSSSPAADANSAVTKPSLVIPGQFEESLFSPRLVSGDVNKRTSNLNAQKEFLKVLETKAENPENRANLTEAVAQLDALSTLLPEKLQTPAQPGSAVPDQEPAGDRRILPAERVAAHLDQLRSDVRQVFLTSWTIDESFEQASDLVSVEREKCRVAFLAQKGIWLTATSRILVALLIAVLGSFVILVCADLVKTFLDTASHTGVVADAINAMRGSTIIAKNHIRQPWPGSEHDIN